MVWKGSNQLKCMNCFKRFDSSRPHEEIEKKTKEGRFTFVFCSQRCLNEFVAVRSLEVSKVEEEEIEA